ncbi:PAS domain S-box-containing protein [Brevundimonas alba]|uniref:histidine kinase n=1 Tax=Brevundimonas alba TaxID=74314 RepID=A0A7X6BN68_9CAUL|nr:PAS domain S-box protein [Brevundimonas alba]NJC41843.1 PAS domain S-box-containing protein [Brevundimonas alba]
MDRVVHLACSLTGTEMGFVSILGDEALSFRSVVGFDAAHVPADISVTRLLVDTGADGILDIPNPRADTRFLAHPLVVGPVGLKSYLGVTIATPEGVPVGSLAVMASTERATPYSANQIGSIRRLARMAGDIYDQTTARRAQREQLEKLTLAEEMGGVGHWRLEPALGNVSWSDEAFRIHGMTPREGVLSMSDVIHLYHPDDQQVVAKLIENGTVGGATYRLRIIRPDGQLRLTQSSARCELDDDGKIAAIFGVIQDITDREMEHAALQASEENYRLLADNLGDVVARLRPSGRITYISPAANRLLGVAPEDLVGRSAEAMVHPDDWPAFRALLANHAMGDDGHRVQHRVVTKDGRAVWVETDCQFIRARDDGRSEIILTARDISDRKRLEEESSAARLQAEAAGRAKSEFLANMSHELRTPLTSVVGFSGVLLRSPALTEADRRYAERIATASEVLLAVINDILDYSKLEAEAVELDLTVFDPRQLPESAASIVETQCEARGVAMVLDIAPDLPRLLIGDGAKIRQVILNFLSNAVKFTHAGEIRLVVGGVPSEAGWKLRVEVQDTGVGIPPDKLDQLFTRFTQADASTTRVYGGTGLGLAISRRLVELSGGEIGAFNRVGGGSCFWFELPLQVAADRDRISEQPAAVIPASCRVLFADDAAPNRELVSVILRSLGLEVEVVADGAQALEAVSGGGYDLVLMDVHMPVMDGLEATRAIRRLEGRLGQIPVIALTANSQPEQVRDCREAGMDAHVGKPIQVPELLRAMTTCFEGALARGCRAAIPDEAAL